MELKAGGQHINVTADNREEFIHLLADYRLNKQVLGEGRRDTKMCQRLLPYMPLRQGAVGVGALLRVTVHGHACILYNTVYGWVVIECPKTLC